MLNVESAEPSDGGANNDLDASTHHVEQSKHHVEQSRHHVERSRIDLDAPTHDLDASTHAVEPSSLDVEASTLNVEASNHELDNATNSTLSIQHSTFTSRFDHSTFTSGIQHSTLTRRDIFNYTYALLHHPEYRTHYAENLKRELPRIPLVASADTFWALVGAGEQLAALHHGYEQAAEYPLHWIENNAVPFSWRVQKMCLSPHKTQLVVNESLTLAGIPPEAARYRLGNRSALEWVIDQYPVTTDKRSGIVSDPNRAADEEYIVRLVGRVVTVSVETVRIVEALPPLGWRYTERGAKRSLTSYT